MSDKIADEAYELPPYGGFGALVEHLTTIDPRVGQAMNAIGDEPASKRDLFEFVRSQGETNVRMALAVAAAASRHSGDINDVLQSLTEGLKEQAEINAKIMTHLLSGNIAGIEEFD